MEAKYQIMLATARKKRENGGHRLTSAHVPGPLAGGCHWGGGGKNPYNEKNKTGWTDAREKSDLSFHIEKGGGVGKMRFGHGGKKRGTSLKKSFYPGFPEPPTGRDAWYGSGGGGGGEISTTWGAPWDGLDNCFTQADKQGGPTGQIRWFLNFGTKSRLEGSVVCKKIPTKNPWERGVCEKWLKKKGKQKFCFKILSSLARGVERRVSGKSFPRPPLPTSGWFISNFKGGGGPFFVSFRMVF